MNLYRVTTGHASNPHSGSYQQVYHIIALTPESATTIAIQVDTSTNRTVVQLELLANENVYVEGKLPE